MCPLLQGPHSALGVPLRTAQPPHAFCDPQVLPVQQPLGHDCALHTHDPPEQVWPDVHATWHPPQLLASLDVLTQALPHGWAVGAEHAIAQAPPLHDAAPVPAVGPGQAAPQTPPLPQLFAGLGSSQVPLQLTLPAGHLHWLLWQVIPPVHAVVQLPQYEALLVVSTQVDPQSVGVGAEQPVTHM